MITSLKYKSAQLPLEKTFGTVANNVWGGDLPSGYCRQILTHAINLADGTV